MSEVDANGVYFNGSGPADSFNVFFWKGGKGTAASDCCKGSPMYQCPNQIPGSDSGGQVTIHLAGCTSPSGRPALQAGGLKFKGGARGKSYYVSVQANMDYNAGAGEWSWMTNNEQAGNPAEWQNPGDGFGTGCTEFALLTVCIPIGEGPDFAFVLHGGTK